MIPLNDLYIMVATAQTVRPFFHLNGGEGRRWAEVSAGYWIVILDLDFDLMPFDTLPVVVGD